MSTKTNRTEKNPVWGAALGAILALLLSLGLVALAALLLSKQTIGLDAVPIVNPVIKTVCALVAALVGSSRFRSKKWLAGAGCAVLYIVVTTLVFAALGGGLALTKGTLVDCTMCAFAGMLGGMIRSLISGE